MAETIKGLKRSCYCGEVSEKYLGQEVTVFGWVQRQRDLGSLIFIDLRDRSGIVQLAFDDGSGPEDFQKAFGARAEYVLAARGTVRKRETVNSNLPNGTVEIFVHELRVLAKSDTPPFEIVENVNTKEDLRLKYRYLDLRRPDVSSAIVTRHKIVKCARDYYDRHGFLEVETPILIKSTPEGARDYLVPSRVHQGRFYALPQSPQLYKQLLMLAGFDRYMQIARCFRDEDLRADRQPEFTQIDLEMSFVDIDDVIAVNEGFMKEVFRQVLGLEIQTPFRRITYREAMERYGSDKPDTRFAMELTDLTSLLSNTGFQVFRGAVAAAGSVRAINVKGMADRLSRKEIDKLTEFVRDYGARGLAFTRLSAGGESSSFEKFLSPEEVSACRAALNMEEGDVALVVADGKNSVVYAALGALRCEVARRLGLIPRDRFDLLWVTEFPLFEYSEEEGRYMAMHHPFTAPMEEDVDKLFTDRGNCRARAYDIVLNGTEVGGGSIRINDPDLQSTMFQALGFTPEQAQEQFGFLTNAFRFGAPPHGGMAYGLDRLVMLMLGKDSIRDVIAFPKVANAGELMTQCPATVDKKQLDELHIALVGENPVKSE